ncbi:pimeloyl-CoA dehydrogenase small subunit [Haematobacter massiliensis]|uniref:Acyl-CoA dehydrogenase n=1 Tax=Haematobacter massiliensis TaxID=195105 RepID=A0A086Y519_9RHOB|nr:acyl-CoA dehydrogenase family protein [Haematobacter massiliensis]KFI29369.1 acyl-CoA dehydrogenase [Haematobacter massiliensis]OWJ71179.1 pimeloyl-CoA dehydrogenase small subunit [Haematobacter massiliensis]OWJ84282.1 pimeloyl-CoA dehydrogenase small subunit [Haematobacter massiliensis]QBJ25988.1 pimeloyl-CoA dehydrogenase small subunit [Haematobacter massiliensis]
MDFDFTSEQSQLKDSVDRFLAARYGSLEDREKNRKQTGGFDPAIWAGYAELGLLGMPFSEEDGGFGGGPVETMIAMEAVGRTLALEPYLSTGVLGATALRLAGNAQQKETLIPEVAEGNLRLSLAFQEPQARYDLFDVATRAEAQGAGFVLTGRKELVLNGDTAGLFIVSARTAGERRDESGITLFLVPADRDGVTVRGYASQDGGRLADVDFSGVVLNAEDVLGEVGQGYPVLERVSEAGIAALAAEAVGAMEALHGLTVDYLKTRNQFGVAIGSFQVLQHKAVDMLLMVEQARSMAYYAAMMVEAEDAAERRAALSAVKVQINRSARFVGQTAVQLHGGIGMTMEYLGAHYFKRLAIIETQFGDTAYHLARVTDAGGLIAAA